MEISITTHSVIADNSDCLILAFKSAVALSASLSAINKASAGYIHALMKSGDIKQEFAAATTLFKVPGIKAKRLILVSLGKSKQLKPQDFKKLYRNIWTQVNNTSAKSMSCYVHEMDKALAAEEHIYKASEALLHLQYRFEQFKSKKAKTSLLKKIAFVLPANDPAVKTKAMQAVKEAQALAKGVSLCRDLGNLPGNICTPEYLASEALKMANKSTVSVKVIDEKSFASLGMGAFLSVAKGSELPAKMIIIHYQGASKTNKPHVLVGKGITFDTGGISLKPGAAMDEMKYDMCGAASVLGCMSAVISSQLKLNVIAIVAAAENMPDGRASKPGDIVTSMSGKTIEILNTDAEGRLVLCDALTYAERFKPASVIDVATLTGACVIALGSHASALYANDEKLSKRIQEAGEKSHDRVWPMPLWPEYQEQLKSPFADLANIGGPKAGSITAACFLENFTKKYSWAHLDIAGTAWNSNGMEKGATGRPVPLLLAYLKSLT